MTAPVIGPDRTEPVAVDTVVTGEWIITLNADREIYRDGAIAVAGGVITEVGKRAAILAKYRPATLIDEPRSIVIPGMVNGHRHLLCCAKGAMPEGGQTSLDEQQLRRQVESINRRVLADIGIAPLPKWPIL